MMTVTTSASTTTIRRTVARISLSGALVGKSPAGGRDLYARIFSSALSSAFVALSTRDVARRCLAALVWSLVSSCIIVNHIPADSSLSRPRHDQVSSGTRLCDSKIPHQPYLGLSYLLCLCSAGGYGQLPCAPLRASDKTFSSFRFRAHHFAAPPQHPSYATIAFRSHTATIRRWRRV